MRWDWNTGVKRITKSAISDHALDTGHAIGFDETKDLQLLRQRTDWRLWTSKPARIPY